MSTTVERPSSAVSDSDPEVWQAMCDQFPVP